MGFLNKRRLQALSFILFLVGINARFLLLPVESDDMTTFLYRWYDYIVENGAWASFGGEFSNYSPPYIYILSLATYLDKWMPKLITIKAVSILFDFINAYLIYRTIRLQYDHETALLGSAVFLCLPTILLNSSAWGQSDGIYTCFVLFCLFLVLRERFLLAVIFFGVALSFKIQAIFIAPFLLLLTLRKHIPWYYYFLVPFVYLAMMIPALLAGRTLWSVLGIVFNQANYYKDLSKNAPNLYLFISNDYYSSVAAIGVLLTGTLAVIWAVGYSIKIRQLDRKLVLICATVAVAAVPYMLPKMHDRYFYLMEVFTLLLAFYIPKTWISVVGAQVVSLLTYYVYLVLIPQYTVSVPIPLYLGFSAAINSFLIGYLLWKQYSLVYSQGSGQA